MHIINKFSITFKTKPYRIMYSLLSDGKYYKVFEMDNVIVTQEISTEEYASQLMNYIILKK
jgi:hypothetical protein